MRRPHFLGRAAYAGPAAIPLLAPALTARAADHRDGPKLADLSYDRAGALDLNDLFIFVSPVNPLPPDITLSMDPTRHFKRPNIPNNF